MDSTDARRPTSRFRFCGTGSRRSRTRTRIRAEAIGESWGGTHELIMIYNLELLAFNDVMEFQVRSYRDQKVASDTVIYHVLDENGEPKPVDPAALWSTIESISPSSLPFLVPGGPPEHEIRILGEGFQPGTEVFTSHERQEDASSRKLPSRFVSSEELRASIPLELWREGSPDARRLPGNRLQLRLSGSSAPAGERGFWSGQ